MKIDNNFMVVYQSEVTDTKTGKVVESTIGNDTKQYIHGVDKIELGLSEAFVGKSKGDKFEIVLPPEKTYGQYNPDAVGRIPSKYVSLPNGARITGKLKPNTLVEVKTPYSTTVATVIKHGLKSMDVDTNHPLAGKTLSFDVNIIDVRQATANEISQKSEGSTGCSCC